MLNKLNLIRLGAYCQTYFDMKPGFGIMEVSPDCPLTVAIPVTRPVEVHQKPRLELGFVKDEVRLEKIVFIDNYEFVYAGYSEAGNKLIIRDGSDRQEE